MINRSGPDKEICQAKKRPASWQPLTPIHENVDLERKVHKRRKGRAVTAQRYSSRLQDDLRRKARLTSAGLLEHLVLKKAQLLKIGRRESIQQRKREIRGRSNRTPVRRRRAGWREGDCKTPAAGMTAQIRRKTEERNFCLWAQRLSKERRKGVLDLKGNRSTRQYGERGREPTEEVTMGGRDASTGGRKRRSSSEKKTEREVENSGLEIGDEVPTKLNRWFTRVGEKNGLFLPLREQRPNVRGKGACRRSLIRHHAASPGGRARGEAEGGTGGTQKVKIMDASFRKRVLLQAKESLNLSGRLADEHPCSRIRS